MGQKSWWGRNWMWAVPSGCLGCLLLPAGCVAAIGFLVFGLFRTSDVYTEALERAREDLRVVEALGEPIEPGWWMMGSINISGPSGDADFSLPLSGPDGSGTLYVVAEKSAGEWAFETLLVEIDGTGERIDLLGDGPRARAAPQPDDRVPPHVTRTGGLP